MIDDIQVTNMTKEARFELIQRVTLVMTGHDSVSSPSQESCETQAASDYCERQCRRSCADDKAREGTDRPYVCEARERAWFRDSDTTPLFQQLPLLMYWSMIEDV